VLWRPLVAAPTLGAQGPGLRADSKPRPVLGGREGSFDQARQAPDPDVRNSRRRGPSGSAFIGYAVVARFSNANALSFTLSEPVLNPMIRPR
jgi:hypothetical protein